MRSGCVRDDPDYSVGSIIFSTKATASSVFYKQYHNELCSYGFANTGTSVSSSGQLGRKNKGTGFPPIPPHSILRT